MKRSISIVAFSALLLFCLCGCASDLNERLLVRAIGVDQFSSNWQVTVLTECFEGSQKEKSYTACGDTVAAALEMIEKQTGKKMLYSHSEIIIFGRLCAEQGLQNCLDFFIRHYDSRPNMKIYVSDTTAYELLAAENTYRNVKNIDLTPLINAEKSGMALSATLVGFINGTFGANRSAGIPIVKRSETLEILRHGIFHDTALICELNDNETVGALILSEKPTNGFIIDTKDGGTVSISGRECSTKLQFTGIQNSRPIFSIDVRIKGEISALENHLYSLPSDLLIEIEKEFAADALSKVSQYLQTAVTKYGIDIVGLGRAVLNEDPAYYKTIETTLTEFLRSAEFYVKVNATIERIEEEDIPYF